MPNLNTFDEASAATQELFDENEQLTLADNPLTEENTETTPEVEEDTPAANETPAEEASSATDTQTVLDEATETAEVAAQAATAVNNELVQARQEIEMLRQQNSQLQGTIDEMSQQNAQSVVEEALKPPTIDFNELAFADEATQQAALEKYAADLTGYNRQEIMKELSPALEFAKQGMREKERKDVISVLSQVPELSGIDDMLPQLDRIIANNKWLSSDDIPMDEKYINAYAIAKGVNSINTPSQEHTEPTTEELMQLYNNNTEFQELVEKQRLEQIKNSQQVPPFSASSGAVNAALNIKEKPTTFEEASRRTREMFGF